MKKRLFSLLLIFISTVVYTFECYSRTKTVSAEYTYHLPENVSQEEARETAVNRARIQAIADEFGTLVTQSTSIMIDNINGQSHTDFVALGGSDVKGEWIEDTEPPIYEYITDGANLALKVKIKGRIRELEGSRISFESNIFRNGITDGDISDRFKSGDDLYVSFNAPTSGYLAIYLLDAKNNAFCLLPYQTQTNGIFETKANHKYLFFHPQHCHGIKPDDIDQIVVDTDQPNERNRILVIFSPNKFFKGADVKQSIDCPRSMALNQFQKWLGNLRHHDKDLVVSEQAIMITAN
ncbi:MAG: DUF4384 domain-containing protein [Bacteroides sp.]|nr:DUF4384 domain-containing protein [Bacteroides sp.]MBD5351189.1 DUF4384 domain-containing protein [Bacteroides sp.]